MSEPTDVDEHGNSPLFFELLREHGADPDLVNKHGQTPRGLAHLIGFEQSDP